MRDEARHESWLARPASVACRVLVTGLLVGGLYWWLGGWIVAGLWRVGWSLGTWWSVGGGQ